MKIGFKNAKDAETIITLLVSLGKISYSKDPADVYAKKLVSKGYAAISVHPRRYGFDSDRGSDFCGDSRADLIWGDDTDAIIKKLLNLNNVITVENVGDYSATISDKGIQVGCQTITFEKFKEIADAVDKVLG